MERRPELIDYLGVVFRWWRLIVTGSLLATVVAVLATVLMTSYYTTEATVLVSKSKAAEPGKETWSTYAENESYISLLDNNTIYLDAMEKFSLRQEPFKMTLRQFQRLVKVRFLPKTDLLSFSFTFPDAALCQRIARHMLDEAVRNNRELNRAEAVESQAFLAQELDRARKDRDEIQQRLLEYRKSSDSGALEGLRNAVLKNVAAIDEMRRLVEAGVANGEAAVVEADRRVAALPVKIEAKSDLSRDLAYQQIVSRMSDSQLTALLGVPFTQEHVSLAHEQAAGEAVKVAVKLAGDRAQLQTLTASLAELKGQAEEWNTEYAVRKETIKDLSDQYDVANAVYETVAVRYSEATMTVGARSQDLRIVDAPYMPDRKSWPQRGVVALVVSQLSLVLFTLAAFLFDYIGRRRARL